ncbi:MAG: nucleotide pyrophosphohydrolase [Gammaproteobacteria bacterium]|nr:nucleotide pyrophosphohydrolase [Gammaproteobacteria bacterium]
MAELEEMRQIMREFSYSREWDKFHSPKNLSMALSVEVSKLMECFQWMTEEQSNSLSPEQIENISDEIADIQLYLVSLADKVGIDIGSAVDNKIKKNELEYPADKVKGS